MGKKVWAIIVGAVLLGVWGGARAEAAARRIDPVVVRGAQLDGLLRQSPEKIRVFAWKNNSWSVIPFQVDERMEVYFYRSSLAQDIILSYAFDSGPKARKDPDPSFDQNDELVFMAADAGPKAGGAAPPSSEACEELILQAPGNADQSYVYACAMTVPGPRSDVKYVTPNGDRELEAAGYLVGFPPDNPVTFDRFQVRGPNGLLPDAVDRLKMRLYVNVIFGVTEYNLYGNDWDHYLRGVRVGPVRVIKEYESVLETWTNMQQRTLTQLYFYPYHLEYDLKAKAVGLWGLGMHRSSLIVGLDLDEPGRGMKFYSERNPRGETVDGKMDASEINLNYGPASWAGVSGGPGTIIVHLGLDAGVKANRDLYYDDNDDRSDPPEDNPGMIGKFGFVIHDLQKLGYKPFSYRFVIYGAPEPYRPGLEKDLLQVYGEPLAAQASRHDFNGMPQDAAPIADTREEPPRSSYDQRRGALQYRYISPAFILDPYLLGYGPGISYGDMDFLGTGMNLGFLALWTDRGYASYDLGFSNLRFIKGVESFEVSFSSNSFPAEPYYGIGAGSQKRHETLYWWRNEEVFVRFKKFFGGIYGADFWVGYKNVGIESGIEPTSGSGLPSVETRFGRNRDLDGRRWGPPVYGWQGGNMSQCGVYLYRDMRDSPNLPKFGNFQSLNVNVVTPALGADYSYVRVGLDLRAYYHPDFLNPIPRLDAGVSSRRTLLTKFLGLDKNRTLAGRVMFVHTFADKINWYGQEILAVPFYDMATLGSSGNLKAYAGNRFRDNDVAFASFEYRWRLWKFQDAALWYDLGLVMNDMFESENWDGTWRHAYGVSYRINVPPNIVITFEWGWSGEEFMYMNQMNYGF